MSDSRFTGQLVLITGGAGGLGRACAEAFLAGGAVAAICDIDSPRMDAAEQEMSAAYPGRVFCLRRDLSDLEVCSQLPADAVAAANRADLDVLVNAVGIMKTAPFDSVDPALFARTLQVNLTGVFATIQAAARLMRGGGSIVSLSSVAGRSGRPNAPDYSASKTALLSLTKSAAIALAPHVRVNAVCPGIFLTDMWNGIIRDRDAEFGAGAGEDYLNEVANKTAMSRAGDPSELAAAVTFLASDAASFITGQAINVDGGLEMN